MKAYFDNFFKYRFLLSELVGRDIKNKYRKSILGVMWTLLNPLLMMIVLSVVFSNLFKFDIENFPLYLLSGNIIYTFFSSSTTDAMSSIISNAGLIKKIYVPKYLFVISRIISSMINLLASFIALMIVMLAMRAELHWTVILSIIPICLLVVFCTGVGLILATITVKFRDVIYLYSVFLTALMYLTPVIYPMSILPNWLYKVVKLNPLTNYLTMFRNVMLNDMIFSYKSLIVAIIEAVLMLMIGLYIFYKKQDDFILSI